MDVRRTVVAIVASVVLAASCSGDDDDGAAGREEGAATTTTAAADAGAENGQPTTTTVAGSPTTVAAEAGGGPVPPGGPQPAQPGRYRYELQQEGQAPTETVLVVQAGDETDAGVYQGHTFLFDGRRRIVRFSADGEVVESVEVVADRRYGGASYACDWEPDATAVPGGALEPGRSWSSETACEFDVDGEQVRHEVSERREVVARRTVSVGGRDVEVVEISRVTTLVATGPSDFRQESTATDLYAPSLGLIVRSDATVVFETGDQRASTGVVLQLLDPEPSAG